MSKTINKGIKRSKRNKTKNYPLSIMKLNIEKIKAKNCKINSSSFLYNTNYRNNIENYYKDISQRQRHNKIKNRIINSNKKGIIYGKSKYDEYTNDIMFQQIYK